MWNIPLLCECLYLSLYRQHQFPCLEYESAVKQLTCSTRSLSFSTSSCLILIVNSRTASAIGADLQNTHHNSMHVLCVVKEDSTMLPELQSHYYYYYYSSQCHHILNSQHHRKLYISGSIILLHSVRNWKLDDWRPPRNGGFNSKP